MQPDIQSLTAYGLKLLDKPGMLDDAERFLVRPYVACLELFLDDMRPRSFSENRTSNANYFVDAATDRKVQRAEVARRRTTSEPRRGVNAFGDDVWRDHD